MDVMLPTTPQRCCFGLWPLDSELWGFCAAVRHYLLFYAMSVIKEAPLPRISPVSFTFASFLCFPTLHLHSVFQCVPQGARLVVRCVLRSLLSVHQLVSAADVTKATVPGPTSNEQRRTRTLRPSGPTSPPTTSPAGRLGLTLVVDVVVLAGSGSVAEGAKPACAVQCAVCTRRNPGPAADLVRPSISGIPAAHSLSTTLYTHHYNLHRTPRAGLQ